MSDWLNKHHKNAKEIIDVSVELERLSDAFYTTGNKYTAEKLLYYSTKIYQAQKEMRDAVSQNINESYKQAQDMSASILKSTLVGIELGRNEGKEGK